VRDDSNHAFAEDPAELTPPDVLISPKGHHATQQEGHPCLMEEPQQEEAEKHALLFWTALSPGDVLSLQVAGAGECVGTVESKTSDGLIIWIRDNLNERKLFHFHDCQFIRLLR
jgi:hypothetical protein